MFDRRDDQAVSFDKASFSNHNVYTDYAIQGQHRGVDFFYAYWSRLQQQAAGKPMRRHVQPRQFIAYMPNVVITEISSRSPFSLKVRLIGTRVSDLYGELTGQDLAEMNNKNALARILAVSQQTFSEQRPILSVTPGIGPSQQNLIAYALYLPLFDETGTPHQIMTPVFVEKLSENQRLVAELSRMRAGAAE